jgi:hypothetical protein
MAFEQAGGRLVHICNDRPLKSTGENMLAVLRRNGN